MLCDGRRLAHRGDYRIPARNELGRSWPLGLGCNDLLARHPLLQQGAVYSPTSQTFGPSGKSVLLARRLNGAKVTDPRIQGPFNAIRLWV